MYLVGCTCVITQLYYVFVSRCLTIRLNSSPVGLTLELFLLNIVNFVLPVFIAKASFWAFIAYVCSVLKSIHQLGLLSSSRSVTTRVADFPARNRIKLATLPTTLEASILSYPRTNTEF